MVCMRAIKSSQLNLIRVLFSTVICKCKVRNVKRNRKFGDAVFQRPNQLEIELTLLSGHSNPNQSLDLLLLCKGLLLSFHAVELAWICCLMVAAANVLLNAKQYYRQRKMQLIELAATSIRQNLSCNFPSICEEDVYM